MNISESVGKAFPELSSGDTNAFYGKIEEWKNIYGGEPPWKNVRRSKLFERGERRMNMVNAAKLLCDNFADLTFAEQCSIDVSDSEYKKFLDETFARTDFRSLLQEYLSAAYALGGTALRVFADKSEIMIDFAEADSFYPVSWQGRSIGSAIFRSAVKKGGDYYTHFEYQQPGKITHRLYRSQSADDLGKPCPVSELYPQLSGKIDIKGITVPMFSYFRPAARNNILSSRVPLGISVFANAQDTLNALDVAFDSFAREFILGRKRIIVPIEAIQTVTDIETGKQERYFDADDEAFVALNTEDIEKLHITDNTVELRVEEHVAAINALLNILCAQTGLSTGSLSFDEVQGVKTATEVISQNSKTARTIRANKNLLTKTIENTIHSVFALANALGRLPKKAYTVTVGWDDSIIIDDDTMIDNTIKLYSAGLIDLETAVMRVNKCTVEKAREIAEKIRKNQPAGDADFF